MTKASRYILLLLLLPAVLGWVSQGNAQVKATRYAPEEQSGSGIPTPQEIINLVNLLRTSQGIPALSSHPVLMKIAQQEANGLTSGMPGHWRPYGLTLEQWLIMEGYPLAGDLTLGGYRSENWASANSQEAVIDIITNRWTPDLDPDHSNTMLSEFRSDIGAGVAVTQDEWGQTVITFVIETALQTSSGQQQHEANLFLTSLPDILDGITTINGTEIPLEAGQYIIPVAINTAQPNGEVFHQVKSGQSLWSIAITYGTTIKDIQRLNNLGAEDNLLEGQNLLVMVAATQPSEAATVSITPTSTPVHATDHPAARSTADDAHHESAAQPDQDANKPAQKEHAFALWAIVFAVLVIAGLIVSIMRVK